MCGKAAVLRPLSRYACCFSKQCEAPYGGAACGPAKQCCVAVMSRCGCGFPFVSDSGRASASGSRLLLSFRRPCNRAKGRACVCGTSFGGEAYDLFFFPTKDSEFSLSMDSRTNPLETRLTVKPSSVRDESRSDTSIVCNVQPQRPAKRVGTGRFSFVCVTGRCQVFFRVVSAVSFGTESNVCASVRPPLPDPGCRASGSFFLSLSGARESGG